MTVTTNINDMVRVKLTEQGWAELERNFRQREYIAPMGESHVQAMMAFYRRRTDADGWTEFQMYDLMHIFGPALYHGMRGMLFERNEVVVGVRDA